MLAALLAAACLAQGPELAPVDGAIERADAIVVARVEALHALKGTALLLAELRVERGLFAAPGERVFAMPQTTKSSKKANELELGRSYVLFLERRGAPMTPAQARSAEPVLGGASVYSWFAHWPVDAESVTIPAGNLPADGGPGGVVRTPTGDFAPRAELVAWLEQRIARSLPSFQVSWASMIAPPQVRVAPDGAVSGDGATKERLTPGELHALLQTFEDERFYELPDRVGAAQGPCAMGGTIQVRTARGRKVVRVHGWYLERLSAAEREAAERAMRIYRALPFDDRGISELDSPEK